MFKHGNTPAPDGPENVEGTAPYISLTAQMPTDALLNSALSAFAIQRAGDAEWAEVMAHLQTQPADHRHQSLDPLGLKTPLFGMPFGWEFEQ